MGAGVGAGAGVALFPKVTLFAPPRFWFDTPSEARVMGFFLANWLVIEGCCGTGALIKEGTKSPLPESSPKFPQEGVKSFALATNSFNALITTGPLAETHYYAVIPTEIIKLLFYILVDTCIFPP